MEDVKAIEIAAEIKGIDEAIEKTAKLKALLGEVKELAAKLDVSITVDGKPISAHQKDD